MYVSPRSLQQAKDLLQQERANSSQLEACRQELQAKYNAKAS